MRQLLLTTLCCLSFSAAAVQELEPLVVTATRTPQSALDTPMPVIVIERAEIERSGAQDAADLLRLYGGAEIGRNGGPGQTASVFMRGTESNHTLVLINGVKFNPATIGGASLHNISPDLIERVEIVKGPRSGLYGSEAIGGVVNIITRAPLQKDGQAVRAFLGGASHNTRQGGIAADYRGGVWRAGLSVDALDTDGFPTRVESDLDSGHRRYGANMFGAWERDGLSLQAGYFLARGKTEYLDFFLTPLAQDFHNSVMDFKAEKSWSEAWDSSLHLSVMRDEIEQVQSTDYAHTRRYSIEWQTNYLPDEVHWFSAGLSAQREEAASQIFGTGFDSDMDNHALFIQDNINSGPHHLLAVLRYSRHDGFGGRLSGGLDYAYQLQPGLRLLSAVGSAFRAPDATDRFGFGGNPELDAETSKHAEIGVEKRWNTQHSTNLSVFYTKLRQLIVFQDPDGFGGPLPGQNQNLERARIKGLEFTYRLNEGPWRASFNAVLQRPRNSSNDVHLARRAERSAALALDYTYHAYTAGLALQAAGPRRDSDFSDAMLPGYGVLDASLQWKVHKNWRVQAQVKNIFDKDYQLAQGYNTGGRLWGVVLRGEY